MPFSESLKVQVRKKAIFISAVLCLLAVNVRTAESQENAPNDVATKMLIDIEKPVQVEILEIPPVKVDAREDSEKPMKVQVEWDEEKPVRVQLPKEGIKVTISEKGWWKVFAIALNFIINKLILNRTAWLVVAACAAASSAYYASRSARTSQATADATKSATETQLFLKLVQEYGSDEMHDTLRELWETYNKWKPSLQDKINEWKKDLDGKSGAEKKDKAEKINRARRRLTFYVAGLTVLRRSGYRNRRLVPEIYDLNLIGLMRKFAIPLTEALDSSTSESIQKLSEDVRALGDLYREAIRPRTSNERQKRRICKEKIDSFG